MARIRIPESTADKLALLDTVIEQADLIGTGRDEHGDQVAFVLVTLYAREVGQLHLVGAEHEDADYSDLEDEDADHGIDDVPHDQTGGKDEEEDDHRRHPRTDEEYQRRHVAFYTPPRPIDLTPPRDVSEDLVEISEIDPRNPPADMRGPAS